MATGRTEFDEVFAVATVDATVALIGIPWPSRATRGHGCHGYDRVAHIGA